jgi:hypothetical protein
MAHAEKIESIIFKKLLYLYTDVIKQAQSDSGAVMPLQWAKLEPKTTLILRGSNVKEEAKGKDTGMAIAMA